MKILRLWNDWNQNETRRKTNGYGGCAYYRVIKPSEQIDGHEITVWGNEWAKEVASYRTTEAFYDNVASEYDMIWTHYIDNEVMFAWLYSACKKHGTKLVMDIDDNFLDLHEKNPANAKLGKGKNKRAFLASILSFCDAITVSTLPLKETLYNHFKEVHGIEKQIFVIPNYNDLTEWKFDSEKNENGVVIGYMGSVSHAEDLEMVMPAIKEVMNKYPNVYFNLMGQMTHSEAKKAFKSWGKLKDRINLVNPTATQKEFPYWLAQQKWDIGIAPLIESEFNKCKSHIKWMEYAMYKIPCVASRVYPYYMDILGIQTIQDMETGILCEKDEWVKKLSMLIEDKKLREYIGENAYNAVKNDWQYKDAKNYINEITSKICML